MFVLATYPCDVRPTYPTTKINYMQEHVHNQNIIIGYATSIDSMYTVTFAKTYFTNIRNEEPIILLLTYEASHYRTFGIECIDHP